MIFSWYSFVLLAPLFPTPPLVFMAALTNALYSLANERVLPPVLPSPLLPLPEPNEFDRWMSSKRLPRSEDELFDDRELVFGSAKTARNFEPQLSKASAAWENLEVPMEQMQSTSIVCEWQKLTWNIWCKRIPCIRASLCRESLWCHRFLRIWRIPRVAHLPTVPSALWQTVEHISPVHCPIVLILGFD